MPQPATELHGSYGRTDAVAVMLAVAVLIDVTVLVAAGVAVVDDEAVPVTLELLEPVSVALDDAEPV